MRRLVLALAVGTAVTGVAVPSFASTLPSPVTVHESTNGGVFVGVDILGQPGGGAAVANGQACVGFSYEVPQCASLPPVSISLPPLGTPTRQQLPGNPVVVYRDDTRTAVGVGDVGVVVYNDGSICPVVSTQAWRCVRAELG